jgi:hypothetical protein
MAENKNLFDPYIRIDGFSPYLLGDSGYLLMPWLMVPHLFHCRMSVLESIYNKHLRAGRYVVENAFGILKQTWRELLIKSDQGMTFMPDLIATCCILHNILLGQRPDDVARLLRVLQ